MQRDGVKKVGVLGEPGIPPAVAVPADHRDQRVREDLAHLAAQRQGQLHVSLRRRCGRSRPPTQLVAHLYEADWHALFAQKIDLRELLLQ